MVWAMDAIAGIKIEVRGRERLPEGAFILAPKHASYGDGFSIYAQFDDLAFVTGLVFGAIFARTGRIWMLMCAHTAYDLTAVALIYANLESGVAHLVFK